MRLEEWTPFIIPVFFVASLLGMGVLYVANAMYDHYRRKQPRKCPKCGASYEGIKLWIVGHSAYWGSSEWYWYCDRCNHRFPAITEDYGVNPVYRKSK